MTVLLDSPQRFENLCAVARTLEVLGFTRLLVHDPFRLVRERYGKGRTRIARSVSGGAFERMTVERVEPLADLLASHPGRVVATVPGSGATPLPAFSFRPDDLVVFGSESRGVSDALLAGADERVAVPQRGATDSLNLGVALGIVLYEALRQLGEGAFSEEAGSRTRGRP